MANTIQIDVVSAEESILSEQAEFVVAPAQMGEVGIYPNHASMITLLKAGSVRIKMVDKASEDQILYLGNGTEPQDLDPHIVTGVPEHNIIISLLNLDYFYWFLD